MVHRPRNPPRRAGMPRTEDRDGKMEMGMGMGMVMVISGFRVGWEDFRKQDCLFGGFIWMMRVRRVG